MCYSRWWPNTINFFGKIPLMVMKNKCLSKDTNLSSMFVERLAINECKQNMTSLRGEASWAKMMSLGGKLTTLVCHLT
jgi:hypothetical protein